MVGFSRQWRKLLFLLLFVHATNLFLCGHEWVKRLSGLDALCLHVVHRVIKEWSARLNLLCMFHTVCTSSSSFYSYSTKAQKKKKEGWWVGCLQEETHRTTRDILFDTSAHRCCKTRPDTCVLTCDGYQWINKVSSARWLLSAKNSGHFCSEITLPHFSFVALR